MVPQTPFSLSLLSCSSLVLSLPSCVASCKINTMKHAPFLQKRANERKARKLKDANAPLLQRRANERKARKLKDANAAQK